MTDALAAGIDALRIDLDRDARTKLLDYVALLAKWNATHNLTAIRDADSMITHHLLDSLAVLPHLPSAETLRLADVGSGGGLPGVPLAIARPAWRVTLIDSNRKKAAFLSQSAIELSLPNVEVACVRAEEFKPASRFDIVIARAYAALETFVAQTRHLVAAGGRLLAMKGLRPDDELTRLPPNIRIVEVSPLSVPGVDAARHLVIMEVVS
ncbi:MAG: 16S rRNA (guanine(527)-N(7))-methyltransferase RsmG [Betaproteobacteria bacterium]